MSVFLQKEKTQDSINIDTKPLLDILSNLEDSNSSEEEYEETLFKSFEVFLKVYGPCLKLNKNPGDLQEFKSITLTIFTSFHKQLVKSVKEAEEEGDSLKGKDLDDFNLLKISMEYVINNISNITNLSTTTDQQLRKSFDNISNYFSERLQIEIDISNQMKEMNDKLEQLANSLQKYVENSK